MFPTQKAHVSFSELKNWKECQHRHWLNQVKKVDLFVPTVHTEFGTSVHDGCENYLLTKDIKASIEIAKKEIRERWKEHNLDPAHWSEERLEKYYKEAKRLQRDKRQEVPEPPTLQFFLDGAANVLEELPVFMDLSFPGWETVAAEAKLYEKLPQHEGMHFKGFIDAIIKVGDTYHVLDWKTGAKPWKDWKRREEMLKYQLIYYRDFWAAKNKIPREQVKCGFVTLAYGDDIKTARCELIEVKPTRKRRVGALNVLNNMINGVNSKRHRKIKKNRFGSNCTYCDYRKSEWCDGI